MYLHGYKGKVFFKPMKLSYNFQHMGIIHLNVLLTACFQALFYESSASKLLTNCLLYQIPVY